MKWICCCLFIIVSRGTLCAAHINAHEDITITLATKHKRKLAVSGNFAWMNLHITKWGETSGPHVFVRHCAVVASVHVWGIALCPGG